MDTKFSSVIYTLNLISESVKPLISQEIAASVGTKASYISNEGKDQMLQCV